MTRKEEKAVEKVMMEKENPKTMPREKARKESRITGESHVRTSTMKMDVDLDKYAKVITEC